MRSGASTSLEAEEYDQCGSNVTVHRILSLPHITTMTIAPAVRAARRLSPFTVRATNFTLLSFLSPSSHTHTLPVQNHRAVLQIWHPTTLGIDRDRSGASACRWSSPIHRHLSNPSNHTRGGPPYSWHKVARRRWRLASAKHDWRSRDA